MEKPFFHHFFRFHWKYRSFALQQCIHWIWTKFYCFHLQFLRHLDTKTAKCCNFWARFELWSCYHHCLQLLMLWSYFWKFDLDFQTSQLAIEFHFFSSIRRLLIELVTAVLVCRFQNSCCQKSDLSEMPLVEVLEKQFDLYPVLRKLNFFSFLDQTKQVILSSYSIIAAFKADLSIYYRA